MWFKKKEVKKVHSHSWKVKGVDIVRHPGLFNEGKNLCPAKYDRFSSVIRVVCECGAVSVAERGGIWSVKDFGENVSFPDCYNSFYR